MTDTGISGVQRRHVLFLASLFPWPLNTGGRQRIFHLARGIAARHDVSVIALDADPTAEDVAAFLANSGCKCITTVPRREPGQDTPSDRGALGRVIGKLRSVNERLRSPLPTYVTDHWSATLVSAIRSFVHASRVDAVYAARSWMAEHARAAGISPIAVDVDDLVSIISRHLISSSGWSGRTIVDLFDLAKETAYEKQLPERFAHVIVVKQSDKEFFAPEHRKRVSVVPNGVTIPPAVLPEPSNAGTLLFVGTLGYGPNIDAINWFAREVLPLIWTRRPDIQFTVAGYGSGTELRDIPADPRCTIYESPADLTPLYARAALVVAPIRHGGGTKIKILEALALGRAVLATPFAAEGLGLRNGVEIELAETPTELATVALELLRDQPRRMTLASGGRRHVAERFDWRRIEPALGKLVSEL